MEEEGNPRIRMVALYCGSKCSNTAWLMVDLPWLWHGVLTRMVVLGDRPRIVASRDRITTVEGGYEAEDKHWSLLSFTI